MCNTADVSLSIYENCVGRALCPNPHASLEPFKVKNVKRHDETNLEIISMTVYQTKIEAEDTELKSTIKGQQTLSKILSNEPVAMNKASEDEKYCKDFKKKCERAHSKGCDN